MPFRVVFLFCCNLIWFYPSTGQSVRHLDTVHQLDTPPSKEAWSQRATWLRERIRFSNGLLPLAPVPGTVTWSEPLQEEGYSVQAVTIETHPGFYLTGSLFLPQARAERLPAILMPHGHWSEGRFQDSDLASVPGRAITFARMGYAVLTYSMVGYNETADFIPHRFDSPAYQLWGFSVSGLQLWNSMSALEFLAGLPFVDPERIGMTGASGGGTQTFLLSAIDTRIAVSVPVNMISAHFQGGCICENGPLIRHDANNIEIGALTAPRAQLMVSTSGDWTLNTPEVEFPAMKAYYAFFDASEKITNRHFNYPHNYNQSTREAVYTWFNYWLKGDSSAVPEPAFTVPFPEKMQAAFPTQPATVEELFDHVRSEQKHHISVYDPLQPGQLQDYLSVYAPLLKQTLYVAPDAFPIAPSGPDSVHRDTIRVQIQFSRQDSLDSDSTFHVVLSTPTPIPDSLLYQTTYNPTQPQIHVAEIKTWIDHIQALYPGVPLEVVAPEGTGPITALALSLLDKPVAVARLDFAHRGFDADADFLEALYIPLLRSAGDLRTAIALQPPEKLTISNLDDGSLHRWIAAIYQKHSDTHTLVWD